ncbi:hypothetical protein BC827DRAFT_1262644 [Russula dissimulans]|nr:hypothetical protein BC827DRAFT_1262644 [Russula dissimulans]
MSMYEAHQSISGDSIWAPFYSESDWELARWAKMQGPSASAITKLLAIPGVVDMLGLSYRTADELNAIIDRNLPGYPSFKSSVIEIGGENLQFYHRDILPCIWAMYGNPEFAHNLVFAPERHYLNSEQTRCVYSEMHTGEWWWSVQTSLESQHPGATIIPLIVSSDKTQLTVFVSKMAYPVYVTIGNIPKEIRRKPSRHTQMLIAYIPTSKLEHIKSKAARRPLIALHGEVGIPMVSRDGVWHRCHPIFGTFISDYPEQALVTCTYYGSCPKCLVLPDQLGKHHHFPCRDYNEAIETYLREERDVCAFHTACREAELKPVFHPFWESFPLVNIFLSITPDVLHQLLQGVVKHLISWVTSPYAFGQTVPQNHHITLFPKGISILSRISGKEYKSIFLRAVRALLDFVYLAQFRCHTDSLARFHENKTIFIDLGIQGHFNIPKFHSLIHYSSSIILFGTTDNYNTEQTERLHIDFTKDTYQATNHKDKIAQMTTWLSCCEKIPTFIKWRRDSSCNQYATLSLKPIGPHPSTRILKMALHPSVKAVSFNDLSEKYGVIKFQDLITDFITSLNYPNALAAALHTHAANTLIPFRSVPVFHKVKFMATNTSDIIDTVVIWPEQTDTHGQPMPPRFDTVLVHGQQDSIYGKDGHRIAQVRVVFQFPSRAISTLFLSSVITLPEHLAYVEWFSYIPRTCDNNHGLYRLSCLMHNVNGQWQASIIHVDSILSSIHLLPWFTQNSLQGTNSFTVLENSHSFYINPFSDVDSYLRFS